MDLKDEAKMVKWWYRGCEIRRDARTRDNDGGPWGASLNDIWEQPSS